MTDKSKGFARETPLVLIADDDSSVRSLLMLALEEEDYQVEEAIHGEDCLAKFARLQPDMILLDAMMPEMDGFACCKHLRSLPEGQQIPILMITFLDDRASIDQSFQVGATDYITKPIHWSVLRQRVRYLLASGQRLKQAETTKAQLLAQQTWEHFLRKSLDQLAGSSHKKEILPNLLVSIQSFFLAERVMICPLDGSERMEALAPGYPSALALSPQDLTLQTYYGAQYQQGEAIAIADLAQAELPTALHSQYMSLKTPAVLTIPILTQQKPWGILCAHRAEIHHPWEKVEIDRFADVANLLSLALGQ